MCNASRFKTPELVSVETIFRPPSRPKVERSARAVLSRAILGDEGDLDASLLVKRGQEDF
jgi:hypothetical protein